MNVKKTDSWLDAFLLLEKYLQKIDDGSRQLVFLDELPWLDTARSGFITAFEGFWNNWGCHRKFILMPSLLAWSDKERCRLLGIRILNRPEYSAMSSVSSGSAMEIPSSMAASNQAFFASLAFEIRESILSAQVRQPGSSGNFAVKPS